MNEASKAAFRRRAEGFYERYLIGNNGIDVGCGDDPVIPGCRTWDLKDGDAQQLPGIPDAEFDWVFSSHCLEHLRDPAEALLNWWKVLKPGGYLCVVVPDEDLYEQGIFPSAFNTDHKVTFTLDKSNSWSPKTYNLLGLIQHLEDRKLIYAKITDAKYDYSKLGGEIDQTKEDAEAAIEIVIQKLPLSKQLFYRTNLRNIMLCPGCKRMSLVIEGFVDKSNTWQLRCRDCGWFGAANFNKGIQDAK